MIPNNRSARKHLLLAGFTMAELIIVILIAGIMVTLAIPSFTSFMQNNRALTISSDFVNALSYTRSEAVKRGVAVSICSASNSTYTACGGAGSWANGWIIFVDAAAGGVVGGNTILRTHDALQATSTFVTAQPFVNYAPSGFINNGAGSFTLSAPGCTGTNGRLVTLLSSGRVDVDGVTCP